MGKNFSDITNSAVCFKDNSIAFISDKPELSSVSCSYQSIMGDVLDPAKITEYHISYSLTFKNIIQIERFNGQILSIVQLNDPDAVSKEGSSMSIVNSSRIEDENENTVLSGTFVIENQEGLNLTDCRLHLNILKLFNSAKHCAIKKETETVISQEGNNVVMSVVADDAEILGWIYPIMPLAD